MRKVMKEKTGLGIAMVLAILILGNITEAFNGAGSGTEEDPYIITDVYQLQEMNNDLTVWYELGNDIDASATKTWNEDPCNPGVYFGFEPIGNDPNKFTGHFDGKRHKISGLYISRSSTDCIGLFGATLSGGVIKNVGLVNVNVNIGNGYYVGGLVGLNSGDVNNCYSTGAITGRTILGGLVGWNYGGSISNCYSTGAVTGGDNSVCIGGLVGVNYWLDSCISNCYSAGAVTGGVGSYYLGGLVGGGPGGVVDSFWDIETSGQSTSAGGTGKTTAEMKQKATFSNWDFDTVWDIIESTTYPFLRGIGWNPPHEPLAQIVVLDWENDAQVRIVSVEIFGKTFSLVLSGTMPVATGLSSEYRAEILQRVQQIFVDSGVDNVVITDSPVDATTVVYFTDWVGDDLLGRAYVGSSHNLGYDRFNRSSDDGAVVFTFANAEVDAETVAHEVGHTFGLRHVDPDIAADPYNASVMDSEYVPGVNPRFINALSDITDLLSPYNHNPVYHLKRYIDGVSHNDLVAQGIYQGTWDMRPLELIRIILDFGASDRVLYDVSLLVGANNDSMMTIANFDAITLSELSGLEFTVENGDLLQLVASSTLGGDLDTLLTIGDPNEEANLLVQPIVGQFKVYLQTESDSDPGYITITEPNVSGTIFDPNSDFERDGDVDVVDLSILAFNWLESNCGHFNCWCEGTDLSYNGFVNLIDFAIFAENWLWR